MKQIPLTYLAKVCECVCECAYVWCMHVQSGSTQFFLTSCYLRKCMGVGDSKCAYVMMSHLPQDWRVGARLSSFGPCLCVCVGEWLILTGVAGRVVWVAPRPDRDRRRRAVHLRHNTINCKKKNSAKKQWWKIHSNLLWCKVTIVQNYSKKKLLQIYRSVLHALIVRLAIILCTFFGVTSWVNPGLWWGWKWVTMQIRGKVAPP